MSIFKRVTDPDYLLCHRCGKPLRGAAHTECAKASLKKARQNGNGHSKIKYPNSSRPFEGIGVIGHTPCRLDDGSTIIPAEEARKIREEGFVQRETGVHYGPWSNGRLRERKRVQRKPEPIEDSKEVEVIEEYWDDEEDTEDLFSIANGYSFRIFLLKISSSKLDVPDEIEEQVGSNI